ncbi:GrpB family protein [Paenibacillus tarimensis]
MLGSPRNKVQLESYNPSWKSTFERDYKLLLEAIGPFVVDIQHVGSTSIEGLEAKPILDIAVAVDSFDNVDEIASSLQSLGFFRLRVNIEGKVVFAKDTDTGRTHYLHLELHNGTHWDEHISFRDYLRSHPEAVTSYKQLKRELALKHSDDVKSYTEGKRKFVDEILERAKRSHLN